MCRGSWFCTLVLNKAEAALLAYFAFNLEQCSLKNETLPWHVDSQDLSLAFHFQADVRRLLLSSPVPKISEHPPMKLLGGTEETCLFCRHHRPVPSVDPLPAASQQPHSLRNHRPRAADGDPPFLLASISIPGAGRATQSKKGTPTPPPCV